MLHRTRRLSFSFPRRRKNRQRTRPDNGHRETPIEKIIESRNVTQSHEAGRRNRNRARVLLKTVARGNDPRRSKHGYISVDRPSTEVRPIGKRDERRRDRWSIDQRHRSPAVSGRARRAAPANRAPRYNGTLTVKIVCEV